MTESNATGDQSGSDQQDTALTVGSRVQLRDGEDETGRPGEIIDDFGPQADDAVVDLGDGQQTRPRRWAIALDDGGLAFVDDESLELEGAGRATLDE